MSEWLPSRDAGCKMQVSQESLNGQILERKGVTESERGNDGSGELEE